MVEEGLAGCVQIDGAFVPGGKLGAAETGSNTLIWPREAREDSKSSVGGGF